MDLQAILSDNQIAVLGCFAALIVCGGIAALSFHFGPGGKISSSDRVDDDAIRPLHRQNESTDDTTRRAA